MMKYKFTKQKFLHQHIFIYLPTVKQLSEHIMIWWLVYFLFLRGVFTFVAACSMFIIYFDLENNIWVWTGNLEDRLKITVIKCVIFDDEYRWLKRFETSFSSRINKFGLEIVFFCFLIKVIQYFRTNIFLFTLRKSYRQFSPR